MPIAEAGDETGPAAARRVGAECDPARAAAVGAVEALRVGFAAVLGERDAHGRAVRDVDLAAVAAPGFERAGRRERPERLRTVGA